MARVTVANAWSKFEEVSRDELDIVWDALSYTVKGAYFIKKRCPWFQGKRSFLNKRTKKFPTGLLRRVRDAISIEIVRDNRRYWAICDDALALSKLRDYQQRALKNIVKAGRGMVSMPTGSGKTIVIAAVMKTYNLKTLVLVHKKDLFKQTVEMLKDWGVSVTFLASPKKDFSGKFVVGMVQTISSMLKKGDEKLEEWLREDVEVLIIDECLDSKTLVRMERGWKRIGDIHEGDFVRSPKGCLVKVNKVWKIRKSAVKVIFKSGRELIMSEDHIVRTLDLGSDEFYPSLIGYVNKPVSEAKNGQFLVGSDKGGSVVFNWRYYFLGWVLGDGHYDGDYLKFGFGKNLEDLEKLFRLIADNLGVEVRIVRNSRGDMVIRFGMDFSRKFAAYYRVPQGKKAGIVEIPEELVSQADISVVAGLFDAEGSIENTGKRLAIDMTSERCIRQVGKILAYYGIDHTIRSYKGCREGHNARWRLSVCGDDIEKFHSVVPCWLKFGVIGGSKRLDKTGWGTSWGRKLKPKYLDIEVAKKLGIKSHHIASFKRGRPTSYSIEIGKEFRRLEDIKEAQNCECVRYKTDGIIKLVPLGERELVDIELADEDKLFVAEGYVVHNCHHATATTWFNIAMNCGAAVRLGFSATCFRADTSGKFLAAATGEVIFEEKIQPLVDKGFLASVKVVFAGVPSVVIPEVQSYLEYSKVYCAGIVDNVPRNNLIVSIVEKLGGRTLIIVRYVRHVCSLVRMFQFRSMECEPVYGAVGVIKRKLAGRRLLAGDIPVIVATQAIWGEGIDLPTVDNLVYGAGGRSKVATVQVAGRVMRPALGKRAIMIDFWDTSHKWLERASRERHNVYRGLGLEVEYLGKTVEFTEDGLVRKES